MNEHEVEIVCCCPILQGPNTDILDTSSNILSTWVTPF